MKKIIMLLLVLSMTLVLFAENITIVYLDRTERNLEGGSFIKKEAKRTNIPHKIVYKFGFKALKGNEKILVILNTGLNSGIDPRVETYITSSPKKDSLILVNLYSVGRETFVKILPAVDSLYAVDEISAATKWDDKKQNPYLDMHQEWTAELFRIIDEKLAQ
jgi:hypothetical protein